MVIFRLLILLLRGRYRRTLWCYTYMKAGGIFRLSFVIFSLLIGISAYGQENDSISRKDKRHLKRRERGDLRYSQIHFDSVDKRGISKMVKANAFYDSIRSDSNSNFITRTIARAVVTAAKFNADLVNRRDYYVQDERYFGKYSGAKIRSIHIAQSDIFSTPMTGNDIWIQRVMDDVHVLTKQRQIRQNLLFKVGDTISPLVMNINENLLRDLPYLSSATFSVDTIPGHPGMVDVWVLTRDNWTISVDIGNSGSTKNRYFDVFDKNFLGYGSELRIRNYIPSKYQGYAFGALYKMDNLWGSFINGTFAAVVGKTNQILQAKFFKPYILPSSSAGGFEVLDEQYNAYLNRMDTIHLTNQRLFNIWIGKSFMLSARKGTSFYVSGKYGRKIYTKRIPVTEYYNPYYHNATYALFSLGFSRENYFQGNYIFGFSRITDIPYGFKLELTGGYEWGEFLRRYYFGGSLGIGDLTRIGYFSAKADMGVYIPHNGRAQQGVLNANMQYFTNLHTWGRFSFRQFLTAQLTMGLNRFYGERERLMFDYPAQLRGLSDREMEGINRFVIRSESVVFTPLYIVGFQVACFGYGDFGWIGDKYAIFKNPFRGTLGVGVRIKNERLVFKNIQLRFGFILNRGPESRGSFLYISNEEDLLTNRFKPLEPGFVKYQ